MTTRPDADKGARSSEKMLKQVQLLLQRLDKQCQRVSESASDLKAMYGAKKKKKKKRKRTSLESVAKEIWLGPEDK